MKAQNYPHYRLRIDLTLKAIHNRSAFCYYNNNTRDSVESTLVLRKKLSEKLLRNACCLQLYR